MIKDPIRFCRSASKTKSLKQNLEYTKKCRPRYAHSRGTMQCWRSCQYSCSIHDYVVPTALCTHVLYTLIVSVQLSFLSDQSEHRIHPGDITQSQMLSLGSLTKNHRGSLTIWTSENFSLCQMPSVNFKCNVRDFVFYLKWQNLVWTFRIVHQSLHIY